MAVRAGKYLAASIDDDCGIYLCIIKNLNSEWQQKCKNSKWLAGSLLELHDERDHLILLAVKKNSGVMSQQHIRNITINQMSEMLSEENYLAGCSALALNAEQLQKCFEQIQIAFEAGRFLKKRKILVWEDICSIKREYDFLASEMLFQSIVTLEDALKKLEELTEKIRVLMPDEEHIISNYLQFLSVVTANLGYDLEQLKLSKFNFDKDISLSEIAEHVAMNESTCQICLKKKCIKLLRNI